MSESSIPKHRDVLYEDKIIFANVIHSCIQMLGMIGRVDSRTQALEYWKYECDVQCVGVGVRVRVREVCVCVWCVICVICPCG